MSWMRLCQSVTASADIALFVGGRARSRRKECMRGGGRKGLRRRRRGESQGGGREDMHKWSIASGDGGVDRHVKRYFRIFRNQI